MWSELHKFFQFCSPKNRKKFYISLIYGVLIGICEATKIPAIMLVLKAIFENRLKTSVILIATGIIVASLIIGSFARGRLTMLQCEAGYQETADKRIDIAKHLRYLPMGYFNKNSLGVITSVTTNTMELLSDVAVRVVMITTQGIITALIITLLITIFDYRIGLLALAGVLLFFLANTWMRHKTQKISAIKVDSDEKLVEEVVEYVQGIAEVKSFNLFKDRAKRLNKAIENDARNSTKMEFLVSPFFLIQGFISKLTGVAIILLSIYLYLANQLTLVNTIGMILCSFIIFASLETAGSFSALLRTVSLCVDKANDILNTKEMDIDGETIHPKHHDIEVRNITFAYENKNIIQDVSLKIKEKSVTAFVGPSGGGKTTLCHLFSRFWDVDQGEVLLGGKNVKQYSMDSLMENFSFVFQNVYLFNDTIANNIRFGNEKASIEEVIVASKKANCHEFISKLPDGYETLLTEGGSCLSGGEKQRISIARAIMKDAPIVILDEATANVDPENEKELMQALHELTKGKTLIMIAHRLNTVRNADRIFVIDNGRIVQEGNHETLMKEKDGLYSRFVLSRERADHWRI